MFQFSILIPTYNDPCLRLVEDLCGEAASLQAANYEIVVADDGSSKAEIRQANRRIATLPHCRYIERATNIGRAAIRNVLAREARYDWLIFVDSDMTIIRADFLHCYQQAAYSKETVFYGGYTVGKGTEENLRYKYERACESTYFSDQRNQHPYADFHTSNFMVPRAVMLSHPFDERFRHYGFEDVFFGKQLQQADIPIIHLDNPLGFCTFEENASFVSKTEEGLRTLHTFKEELTGYSNLLKAADRLERLHLSPLLRQAHRAVASILRRQLCGSHPSLFLFKFYKLSYFMNL